MALAELDAGTRFIFEGPGAVAVVPKAAFKLLGALVFYPPN